jgi:transcription factor Ssl1
VCACIVYVHLCRSRVYFVLMPTLYMQVCALKLLSSAHLARSFHHLFPVPAYAEIPARADVDDDDDNAERGGASSKGRAGVGTMAPSDEVSECRACGVLVSGATGECMQREGDDDRR